MSRILSRGGSASVHAGIHPPPGPGTHHSPGPGRPPLDQANTPPPGKQTPAYGLRAAGTHPTGMHSCFTSVCHSFCPQGRGIGFPACITGHMTRGVYIQGGLHVGGSASKGGPRRIVQDTVNKRAVRILLKCILVFKNFSLKFLFTPKIVHVPKQIQIYYICSSVCHKTLRRCYQHYSDVLQLSILFLRNVLCPELITMMLVCVQKIFYRRLNN